MIHFNHQDTFKAVTS